MGSARRLTGATGRWSAAHPRLVIAAWVGGVVALLVAGHLASTAKLSNADASVGQAGQAEHMISRYFTQRSTEYVLFDSASLRVGAPAYQAAIRDVLTRIEATQRVTQVRSPLDPKFAHQ